MRVVRNIDSLKKVIEKRRVRRDSVSLKVAKILRKVKDEGDKALIEYTKKFDKVKIPAKGIQVSESEISAAFGGLNSSLISSFKIAIENITKFYKSQVPKTKRVKNPNGKKLISRYIPLAKVGVYVPAGTAPLISSVYMSVIPALVAGVDEVVLVSPPDKEGRINPFILVIASLLKIKKIYRAGGAQAIASLAYGTEAIEAVDKIVGPGNEYVTEAKRQVFGQVDIDMLAGPSEIVVIASSNSNVDYIIADLEAQTEHHKGLGVVVTNSKRVIRTLRQSKAAGYALRVRNLDKAAKIVNGIAPEHLAILTKKPHALVNKIKNAGAIFLGGYSPVALGDYTAGPSHVLPTGGSSRFFSTLSVKDFLKESHIIRYTKKAVLEEFDTLEKIAGLEGMKKHIESVRKRIDSD